MADATEPTRAGSSASSGADTAGVETLERTPPSEGRAGPRGSGGAGGVLRSARVAWAVAVLALLAAAVSGAQWQSLAAEARAREDAREAAEVMAAQVTTFEGATIDEFVEDVRALATGEYADQVTELFNADFREALRENEVRSVGEVTRSFVQDLDGDEAEVFVVVRQTSVNAVLDEPVEDELRMDLTLAREDGRWLVSDVAILGPTPPALPPPAADGGETPEEPQE